MKYYLVGVRSKAYHGRQALTYSADEGLQPGAIVTVSVRASECLGVVLRNSSQPKGISVKKIIRIHEVSLPQAQLHLIDWLRVYYPGPMSSIIQLFLPESIRKAEPESKTAGSKKASLPPLTLEQKKAIELITSQPSGVSLLHGNTGTGKTRVYQELATATISDKKSVIILTPEIGLAPQLEQALTQQFPNQVVVWHSHMTRVARDKAWAKIRSTSQPLVIIGARSALFAPLNNLGLIIVDEAHDSSYKQDQSPHYDATRVAAKLASLTNSRCVLGSATPTIADYHSLSRAQLPVARLQKPIHEKIKPPSVEIIDISARENFARSSIFSENLLKNVANTLASRQQSLIFLNRRGSARQVSCEACGWQADCPHCAVALVYHADSHSLRCHICGFRDSPPTSCPSCGSSELRFQKRGTKALETELKRLFPEARVRRFDSDTSKADSLEQHYQAIKDGKIDILIGTQVMAKGLDLPNLTFVGVPMVETGSQLPDFSGDEKFYQLLRQVMGRVGRRSSQSRITLQTYNPHSPLLKSIVSNDWPAFYKQQLRERKKFNYPPFCYLLQLTCVRKQRASAQKAAAKLADELRAKSELTILGPSPRFYEKKQGSYHWQIIVKATNRQKLLQVIDNLPANWRFNIDPSNLL